jgi:hypothetical protein
MPVQELKTPEHKREQNLFKSFGVGSDDVLHKGTLEQKSVCDAREKVMNGFLLLFHLNELILDELSSHVPHPLVEEKKFRKSYHGQLCWKILALLSVGEPMQSFAANIIQTRVLSLNTTHRFSELDRHVHLMARSLGRWVMDAPTGSLFLRGCSAR